MPWIKMNHHLFGQCGSLAGNGKSGPKDFLDQGSNSAGSLEGVSTGAIPALDHHTLNSHWAATYFIGVRQREFPSVSFVH